MTARAALIALCATLAVAGCGLRPQAPQLGPDGLPLPVAYRITPDQRVNVPSSAALRNASPVKNGIEVTDCTRPRNRPAVNVERPGTCKGAESRWIMGAGSPPR